MRFIDTLTNPFSTASRLSMSGRGDPYAEAFAEVSRGPGGFPLDTDDTDSTGGGRGRKDPYADAFAKVSMGPGGFPLDTDDTVATAGGRGRGDPYAKAFEEVSRGPGGFPDDTDGTAAATTRPTVRFAGDSSAPVKSASATSSSATAARTAGSRWFNPISSWFSAGAKAAAAPHSDENGAATGLARKINVTRAGSPPPKRADDDDSDSDDDDDSGGRGAARTADNSARSYGTSRAGLSHVARSAQSALSRCLPSRSAFSDFLDSLASRRPAWTRRAASSALPTYRQATASAKSSTLKRSRVLTSARGSSFYPSSVPSNLTARCRSTRQTSLRSHSHAPTDDGSLRSEIASAIKTIESLIGSLLSRADELNSCLSEYDDFRKRTAATRAGFEKRLSTMYSTASGAGSRGSLWATERTTPPDGSVYLGKYSIDGVSRKVYGPPSLA